MDASGSSDSYGEAPMKGKPTNLVIIAVAVLLLSEILFAFAMNHTIGTGTCSSTGYTQYGPAPKCPPGSVLSGLFIPAGVALIIMSSLALGSNIGIAGLFMAIGIGSLSVATGSTSNSGDKAFPLIFGGCFLLSGLVWAVVASVSIWNKRPIQPAAPAPTSVVSVAGLGPATETHRPGSFAFTPRIAAAAVVWLAAIAGGVALGSLSQGSSPKAQVDITRAALPRPTGAAVISADDPGSLFKASNLAPVLAQLARRFGSDGNVVALALYPGQLDAVIAGDDDQARLVTAGTTGTLTVGSPVSFEGARQAVDISQLSAAVPQRLAKGIDLLAKVPATGLDRFVIDLSGQLARWRVYPIQGSADFEALLTGGEIRQLTLTGNPNK
jgi:hypothetical protein